MKLSQYLESKTLNKVLDLTNVSDYLPPFSAEDDEDGLIIESEAVTIKRYIKEQEIHDIFLKFDKDVALTKTIFEALRDREKRSSQPIKLRLLVHRDMQAENAVHYQRLCNKKIHSVEQKAWDMDANIEINFNEYFNKISDAKGRSYERPTIRLTRVLSEACMSYSYNFLFGFIATHRARMRTLGGLSIALIGTIVCLYPPAWVSALLSAIVWILSSTMVVGQQIAQQSLATKACLLTVTGLGLFAAREYWQGLPKSSSEDSMTRVNVDSSQCNV